MRRYGWYCHRLVELDPYSTEFEDIDSVLGMHQRDVPFRPHTPAYKIHIRLRWDENPDFWPKARILDALLHELCHFEVERHNRDFDALWDQLRAEHARGL
jgi:hypothetical protein